MGSIISVTKTIPPSSSPETDVDVGDLINFAGEFWTFSKIVGSMEHHLIANTLCGLVLEKTDKHMIIFVPQSRSIAGDHTYAAVEHRSKISKVWKL
jgi:hypothetical protein